MTKRVAGPMFFLYRGRYAPFVRFGLGVALVIFALAVSSASRFVLVLGGVLIVTGIATGIVHLRGGGRDSSRGAPGDKRGYLEPPSRDVSRPELRVSRGERSGSDRCGAAPNTRLCSHEHTGPRHHLR
jgi:hypothetical protein